MKNSNQNETINEFIEQFKKEIDKETIDKLVEQMKKDYNRQDIKSIVFQEWWASSATGYVGMISQDVITLADTLIVYCPDGIARVYFGGDILAYEIKNPNDVFWKDVKNKTMKDTSQYQVYESI